MESLTDVERARALMTEAIEWSVMKWLADKKKVRKIADRANEVLNATEAEIHAKWNPKLKAAYDESGAGSPQLKRLAKSIREEHEAANRFRMEAEATFDLAEKRLSTALAREGCRQAINGWEHHLQAIRLAESALEIK
jgi:hypothetical protein